MYHKRACHVASKGMVTHYRHITVATLASNAIVYEEDFKLMNEFSTFGLFDLGANMT